MTLTPDNLLGKRYRFTTNTAMPEFTVVAYDAEKGLRVHATDGGRWWLPLDYVAQAFNLGVLVESSGAPFTWDYGVDPTLAQQAATRYTDVSISTIHYLQQKLRMLFQKETHGRTKDRRRASSR